MGSRKSDTLYIKRHGRVTQNPWRDREKMEDTKNGIKGRYGTFLRACVRAYNLAHIRNNLSVHKLN